MTTLLVQHEVQAFEDWKQGFDGHEDGRKLHGATGHRLVRDGNRISILIDFPDSESAKSFVEDPALREVMSKAGVIGAPTVTIADDVESVTY
jgi:hypothetical protein